MMGTSSNKTNNGEKQSNLIRGHSSHGSHRLVDNGNIGSDRHTGMPCFQKRMDKFIGYQVTATHHTSQIASQVSALTTQASVNEATLFALNKTMEKLVQALDNAGG